MMTHLTPARLREIAENRYAPTQSVYSDLERDLARALLAEKEKSDAAVALLREALIPLDFQTDEDGWLCCNLCNRFADSGHSADCLHTRIDSFLAQHSPAAAPDATVSGAETEKSQ